MATQRTVPAPIPGTRVPMSYEEYLTLEGEVLHAEWVNGEVVVFMPPSSKHQILLFWLARVIGLFAEVFDLGDVHVAPLEMRATPGGPAREPDIFFVAREHRDRMTTQRLNGPADLICELISPESVRRDQVEKLREYAAAGVREYWLFDSRPVPILPAWYRLTEAGTYAPLVPDADGRLHSTVLPGFWLDPAWLAQEPLPAPLAVLQKIAPQALRAALKDSE